LVQKYRFPQSDKERMILQTVYKDYTLKSCYGKPYERKLNVLDCECKTQTIDQLSTVYELGTAAEEDNLFSTQILWQSPDIESNTELEMEIFVQLWRRIQRL
jgi:hypothetical protein